MSVSIKKTGVVSVSGGTNMNLMPNSYIMPLGTNNPATGTWRLAGSNNMTRSRVLIENGMYGFQNSGIQTTPSGGYVDASCYSINNFPMEANTDYILSMWARITEGTEGYAGYSIYASSYVDGSDTKTDRGYRVTPLTKEWQRVWIHFRTNATENRNIYIGITTGETEVTTQMCLIKLEKGSVLTPWIPFLTDDIAVADYSTTTLSGEIVSFNDGAYNVPLKSIITTVEPIQSGSGDPYPAGGGKNKCNAAEKAESTTAGIKGKVLADNEFVMNGKSTGNGDLVTNVTKFIMNANQPYTFSFTGKDTRDGAIYVYFGGTYQGVGKDIHSFTYTPTTDLTVTNIRFRCFSGVTIDADFKLQIEASSSATSYAAYSNIRPISGRTASSLTRTGVNLWGGNALLQSFINANISGFTYDTTAKTLTYNAPAMNGKTILSNFKFKENTQYTLILVGSNASNYNATNLRIYYSDGTNSLVSFPQAEAGLKQTCVFTSSSGKTIDRVAGVYAAGIVTLYYNECGLFEGILTASNFVAYNGNTYTLQFGDTYYGGELDVTSGVLTIIGALYTTTWTQYNQNNGYKAYRSSSYTQAKSYANAKSNMVADFGSFSSSSMNKNIIQLPIDTPTYVYMALDENADPTAVQIYYELATPFTIQLSPTVIMQLKNQNNIWCDTGVVDECKYISHSSQVDTNFIETHPLLTQVNNSYINSNNFIEI